MLNFVQFYVLVQDASCGEKNDPMGLFIRFCYNNSLEVKRYSSWNNWWIMHLRFGHNDLINIVGKVHLKAKRSPEQLIIDTFGSKGKNVQLLLLLKKGRKIWGIKNTLIPSEIPLMSLGKGYRLLCKNWFESYWFCIEQHWFEQVRWILAREKRRSFEVTCAMHI